MLSLLVATFSGSSALLSCDPKPSSAVTAKGVIFAGYYNSRQFANLQALYVPSAVLVPPTADAFITQANIGAFFQAASDSGLKNLKLNATCTQTTAVDVRRDVADHGLEQRTHIHEIGVATASIGQFSYYTRWRVLPDGDIGIDLDVMHLHPTFGFWNRSFDATLAVNSGVWTWPRNLVQTSPSSLVGNASSIVKQEEFLYGLLYNSRHFQALASFYSLGSVLVDSASKSFQLHDGLIDFFNNLYDRGGVMQIQLNATVIYQPPEQPYEDIHSLGTLSTNVGSLRYYTGYRFNGEVWVINVDLLSVGV